MLIPPINWAQLGTSVVPKHTHTHTHTKAQLPCSNAWCSTQKEHRTSSGMEKKNVKFWFAYFTLRFDPRGRGKNTSHKSKTTQGLEHCRLHVNVGGAFSSRPLSFVASCYVYGCDSKSIWTGKAGQCIITATTTFLFLFTLIQAWSSHWCVEIGPSLMLYFLFCMGHGRTTVIVHTVLLIKVLAHAATLIYEQEE